MARMYTNLYIFATKSEARTAFDERLVHNSDSEGIVCYRRGTRVFVVVEDTSFPLVCLDYHQHVTAYDLRVAYRHVPGLRYRNGDLVWGDGGRWMWYDGGFTSWDGRYVCSDKPVPRRGRL